MPRPLLLALIPFLFSATLYGQEAKKPSPAVKRILDEAVRAVKKNRVDFDKANQKPLGEARKALEDLSKKLIEDGKAEEATAVLRQVGNLEADVMRMANAPEPVPPPRPVPQKPLLERLVGKWTHPNSSLIFHFEPDGSFHENKKKDGTVNAHGRVVLVTPDVAEVQLSNRYRLRVSSAGPDILALLVWDPDGKPVLHGFVLERLK